MNTVDATPAGSMLHVMGTADVLLCMPEAHPSLAQMDVMRKALEERFPGFNFTFACGVSGVLVAQR